MKTEKAKSIFEFAASLFRAGHLSPAEMMTARRIYDRFGRPNWKK